MSTEIVPNSAPESFETQAPPTSPHNALRRLPQTIHAIGLEPRLLRAPDGQTDEILAHKPGAKGRAMVIENWLRDDRDLPIGHQVRVSGEGYMTEFVSQDILHVLAREFSDGADETESYGVILAPYVLDKTDEQNRGGDMLLVKHHPDGSATAISLIDVKMARPSRTNEAGRQSNTARRLKTGMNRKLDYPIPAIVVFLGDTTFVNQKGERLTLRQYIDTVVYALAKQDQLEEFLPQIDRGSMEALFDQVRHQVHKACLATKGKIKETAETKEVLDRMLYQLATTDKVLGSRTRH